MSTLYRSPSTLYPFLPIVYSCLSLPYIAGVLFLLRRWYESHVFYSATPWSDCPAISIGTIQLYFFLRCYQPFPPADSLCNFPLSFVQFLKSPRFSSSCLLFLDNSLRWKIGHFAASLVLDWIIGRRQASIACTNVDRDYHRCYCLVWQRAPLHLAWRLLEVFALTDYRALAGFRWLRFVTGVTSSSYDE